MKTGFDAGVGFIAGVIVTCLVVLSFGESESEKEVALSEAIAKPKKPKRAMIQSAGPSVETLDLKSSLLKSYGDDREKLLTGLPAGKLQELVKVIEGEANFIDGLDYKAEGALEAILTELATNDLGSMVNWVKSQYDSELSDKILQDWFGDQKLIEKREAFELAKKYLGEEAIADLAGSFMLYGHKEGATTDDALYYLDYVTVSSGSGGSDIKFAEGFDFEAFAGKSLKRLEEDKENGSSLSSYPTNFYKEWVKHDSEGAFAFFEENVFERDVELPFNDYSDMVEGYIESAPTAESAAWLADVLDNGDLDPEEYKDVIQKLQQQKLGGIGYSKTLLEYSADPQLLLAEIAAETFQWGGRDEKFAKALKSFDSFEQYLEGAERAILNHSPMYSSGHSLLKIMENMARPQAEVERVNALFKQASEERTQKRFEEMRQSRS